MITQGTKVLQARAVMLKRVLEDRLEAVEGPITASDLAGLIGIHSENREANRRLVRGVVAHAREHEGMRICADAHGCWLARSSEEWDGYAAAVKARTVFGFVRMAKVQRAATEALSGQRRLFGRMPEVKRRAEWANA